MLKIIIPIYLIFISNPVLANLITTGRTLTKKSQDLGKIIIGLFVILVGFYYVSGNDRAREKAQSLFVGAFLILAGRSILTWLQAAIR
jgi:hypothetical protein